MVYEAFVFDISRKLNISQSQADATIKMIADTIVGIVQDRGEVPIPGLGRFVARTIKAHPGLGALKGKQVAERSRVGLKAFGEIHLRPLTEHDRKTA
jgi:nucleoid DNA-binding protein